MRFGIDGFSLGPRDCCLDSGVWQSFGALLSGNTPDCYLLKCCAVCF